MTKQYVCTEFFRLNNIYGKRECKTWQEIDINSLVKGSVKLTNEQINDFVVAIAFLFATVAIFKIVRRSFF